MFITRNHIPFMFSPRESGGSKNFGLAKTNGSSTAELAAYIAELKKANEEILNARRAALNVMEDAILAKEALEKSEAKYRMLFNSIDEGFHIIQLIYDSEGKAIDYRYRETNEAFERHTGLHNVAGKLGSEVSPGTEDYWFNAYDRVIKTGVPIRFENYNGFTDRWYSAYAFRASAESAFVAVLFSDITERKIRERQQAFLLSFTDAIRNLTDPEQIQKIACEKLGTELRASRVNYAEVNGDEYVVANEFFTYDLLPMKGHYQINSFREEEIDSFRQGETVIIGDISAEPGFSRNIAQAYESINVCSFVSVPLVKSGNLVVVLSVIKSQPHKWNKNNVKLIEEVAERTWAAVERAKAEEALRKAEEKYRIKLENDVAERTAELSLSKELLQATMNASMDMIQVFEAVRNEKGEIVDFKWVLNNHESERYYGNVIGKSLLTLNRGVIEEGIFDIFKKVVETGIPDQTEHHYVHEQFNGWFYQSVVKLGDGVATTTTDITAKKEAEEEISKQAKYIQRITQTVPGMISVMHLQSGKIEYINNEVFHSEGFDAEQMKKMTRSELRQTIHKDDHEKLNNYYAAFDKINDTDDVSIDYRAVNNTGTWQWYRVRGKIFQRDKNGKVTHIVNIVQNITTEKEAEEKINQLNNILLIKNRELESANTEINTFNNIAATDYKETLKQLYTNFEYIVSHDAKNLTDSGKANIRRAQSGIQKIKLLTDDIINFSKIKTFDNEITIVDLNEILKNELLDLHEKNKLVNAKIEADPLPVINGYPLLLSLLFHHLIDNSIKFRKQDHLLQVNISCAEVENLAIDNAIKETSYYKIAITDNGIGFKQSEAESIFTMFHRLHEKSKYKGSGVGLAICKKVLDLHEGFIVAESSEGRGATFICFLPKNLHAQHFKIT